MNSGVYAVFDRAAKSFGSPMLFANDAMCVRGSTDLFRGGGQAPMILYPADFDVYRIADYDSDLGIISGLEHPVLVVRFIDIAHSVDPDLRDVSRVDLNGGMPASEFPEVL